MAKVIHWSTCVYHVNMGDEGLLSLVAGLNHCQNLVELSLYGNNEITVAGLRTLTGFLQSESCRLESLNMDALDMRDEGVMVLATGLRDYKVLKCLYLSRNFIGDEGITALASTLVESESLQCLDLSSNYHIGDTGVAALVSGITAAANTSLENLRLSGNAFTTAGIRSLATLVESERSCLKVLDLGSIRDADEQSAILANALANNTSLTHLGIGYGIPKAGEEAFSKLLCDTSSINTIYSSNHTLEVIGDIEDGGEPEPSHDSIKRYLMLNRNTRVFKYHGLNLMCKILINYPDLGDMEPFYRWKLKFLPLIADWFQRACYYRNYLEESFEIFQCRELSGIYKFIRGVPLLVSDGYWSQQLEQVHVKKRRFEEAEKQLLLELLAKKRKVEEEEMQVLDRLSGMRASV